MTLTEFLLARIAEDEAVCRRAQSSEWWQETTRLTPSGPSIPMDLPGRLALPYGTYAAEHIARHDPARVLAECEAKRRIVKLHGSFDPDPDEAWHVCWQWTGYGEGDAGETGAGDTCQTMTYLALPYADHPDYDPAWSPR